MVVPQHAGSGPRPWPLVKPGATQATNWRVLAAQHLLRAHGASIVADGVFGPAERRCRQRLPADAAHDEISSTIGQLDWPALIVTVKAGAQRRGGAGAADAARPATSPWTGCSVRKQMRPCAISRRCSFRRTMESSGQDLAGARRAAVRLTRRQPSPASALSSAASSRRRVSASPRAPTAIAAAPAAIHGAASAPVAARLSSATNDSRPDDRPGLAVARRER